MIKAKVLKEMPKLKVGDIIEVCSDAQSGFVKNCLHSDRCGGMTYEEAVMAGWLEWIDEEKSLYDKFHDYNGKQKCCNPVTLSEISKKTLYRSS